MKWIVVLITVVAAFTPHAAFAQHSAYKGQEGRSIKALSAEEIDQYLSGAGMGFARAAELNRFPGPMHVLEMSAQLELSAEQRDATERLMGRHKADARIIGAKLIEAERTLDLMFASGSVGELELAGQVKAVAALQGEYRLSHLETHRQMRAILSRAQIERYDQLRGYAAARDGAPGAHPGHH